MRFVARVWAPLFTDKEVRIMTFFKLIQGHFLAICFLAAVAAFGTPSLWAAGGSCDVAFDGNALSVVAKNEPLGHVLEAVKNKTGIEFVVPGGVGAIPVNFDFNGVALAKALKTLLKDVDHTVIAGANNRILKVMVVDKGGKTGNAAMASNASAAQAKPLASMGAKAVEPIVNPARGGAQASYGNMNTVPQTNQPAPEGFQSNVDGKQMAYGNMNTIPPKNQVAPQGFTTNLSSSR